MQICDTQIPERCGEVAWKRHGHTDEKVLLSDSEDFLPTGSYSISLRKQSKAKIKTSSVSFCKRK
jgi:hypothetical protein